MKHFLEVLDELNRLNVEFISFREQIDTAGPLGRAIMVIVGAVAELERSLIVERVRAGMRRAKLEGRHIGRRALVLDRAAIFRDRQQVARAWASAGEGPSCLLRHHPPCPQLFSGERLPDEPARETTLGPLRRKRTFRNPGSADEVCAACIHPSTRRADHLLSVLRVSEVAHRPRQTGHRSFKRMLHLTHLPV